MPCATGPPNSCSATPVRPLRRWNHHDAVVPVKYDGGPAAAAMGFGYGAWNVGILHGNVTILAGASYFIPVLSAAFSTLLLRAALPLAFWQGAAMVCGGAILCWLATRARRAPPVRD